MAAAIRAVGGGEGPGRERDVQDLGPGMTVPGNPIVPPTPDVGTPSITAPTFALAGMSMPLLQLSAAAEEAFDEEFRRCMSTCVEGKIGALGWALDGLTGLVGLDTNLEQTFRDNYVQIEAIAAAALAGGQAAAQPRVRAGTAAGRMLQGEVTGARIGQRIGRLVAGVRGYVPGNRVGRVAGGAATYAIALGGAALAGYVAGAAAECARTECK